MFGKGLLPNRNEIPIHHDGLRIPAARRRLPVGQLRRPHGFGVGAVPAPLETCAEIVSLVVIGDLLNTERAHYRACGSTQTGPGVLSAGGLAARFAQ